MNFNNSKTKRISKAIIAITGLFFIFIFLLIPATGCDMSDEEDLDLGYKIYIPNMSSKSITIIPKKKSDEPDVLDLDYNPIFIRQRPNTDDLYCLNEGTNKISIINMDDDTIDETFTFEVGTTSAQANERIKFTDDGKKAYVITSYQPSGIAVLDPSDNSFVEGVNLGSVTIDRMFFSSTGNRLYCTDSTLQKIYSINTNTEELVETINVPEEFDKAYYDSDKSQFYMSESGTDGAIKVYDVSDDEIVERIDNVADNITFLRLSPDKKKLYVLGTEELVIVELSDYTIDDRINLEYSDPTDFKFLPDKSFILAPSGDSDLLMILKTDDYDTEDTIATESNPGEIVIKN